MRGTLIASLAGIAFATAFSREDGVRFARGVVAYAHALSAPEPPKYDEPDAWLRHGTKDVFAHSEWELAQSPYMLLNLAGPPATRMTFRLFCAAAAAGCVWLLSPLVARRG